MTKFSKQSGFTLIELLVTMAIVAILAGTAIVNFSKNSDRDMKQERERFTSFLREVQNKALAGDRSGITLTANQKMCGFGVNQQGGSIIQAYYIVAGNLDADCSTTANSYDSTRKLEVLVLSNNVTISGSFSDVFFLSPNGKIYYGGSDTFTSPITINLTRGGSSGSIPIHIDQSGRIY
jgi:prepilin-type N-terminal cleavage/methylation domain-containing protein